MDCRSCDDCGYLKTYVNRRLSTEDNVVWLNLCENINCESIVTDLSIATTCTYYDDDSWMK